MIMSEVIDKIRPGSRVRVSEKIKEGGKERESIFEGIVIARKHGKEPGASFTVRAIVDGVGVEKIYPVWSPSITKAEIISSSKKIRRAKLYFARGLSEKKLKEKLGV